MIANRKILLRYIPSALIIIVVLLSLYFSIFISGMGNKCDDSAVNKIISLAQKQETVYLADQVITGIQKKNYRSVIPLFDKQLRDSGEMNQGLDTIKTFFPNEKLNQLKIVGYSFDKTITATDTVEKISTVIEAYFATKVVLIDLRYYRTASSVQIIAFKAYPSDEVINSHKVQASLSTLTVLRLLVILCSIAVLLTATYALILCINTDIPKRKWLWIIFILFGITGIDFNWTSQEFSLSLISIRLLGVGWFRASCYDPLLLNLSIPLGAIAFLIRNRKNLLNHKKD